MPNFKEHFDKSRKNFELLEIINRNASDFYDWQVTICFYTALHLINAYLAMPPIERHCRTHDDIMDAINPYGLSVIKVPEGVNDAYKALYYLSRRARYLHERDPSIWIDTSHVQLCAAIGHLHTILVWFEGRYPSSTLNPINVKCSGLIGNSHFVKVK